MSQLSTAGDDDSLAKERWHVTPEDEDEDDDQASHFFGPGEEDDDGEDDSEQLTPVGV